MKIIKNILLPKKYKENVSSFSKVFHKSQPMDDFIRNLVERDSDEDINEMYREAKEKASRRKRK